MLNDLPYTEQSHGMKICPAPSTNRASGEKYGAKLSQRELCTYSELRIGWLIMIFNKC